MYGRPYLVCFIKPPLIFSDARRSRTIVGPDLQDLNQLMFNVVSWIFQFAALRFSCNVNWNTRQEKWTKFISVKKRVNNVRSKLAYFQPPWNVCTSLCTYLFNNKKLRYLCFKNSQMNTIRFWHHRCLVAVRAKL